MSKDIRYISLDTETTGLYHAQGDRVISIGAVEIINWREGEERYWEVNPERAVGEEALRVHGLTDEMLRDKPKFAAIQDQLLEFIAGAELVIHNAPFDVGFLDNEFKLSGKNTQLEEHCAKIHDSRLIAQHRYPGASTGLDAMCKRFKISLAGREKHGALIDAQLLASVWIRLNSDQKNFDFAAASAEVEQAESDQEAAGQKLGAEDRQPLKVISASPDELAAHEKYVQSLDAAGKWQ